MNKTKRRRRVYANFYQLMDAFRRRDLADLVHLRGALKLSTCTCDSHVERRELADALRFRLFEITNARLRARA